MSTLKLHFHRIHFRALEKYFQENRFTWKKNCCKLAVKNWIMKFHLKTHTLRNWRIYSQILFICATPWTREMTQFISITSPQTNQPDIRHHIQVEHCRVSQRKTSDLIFLVEALLFIVLLLSVTLQQNWAAQSREAFSVLKTVVEKAAYFRHLFILFLRESE